MKKLIAFVCAAVLTVSTAVTALAQPSVTVTGVVTGTQTATDKNGNTVTVEIQEVPEEYADAVAEVKTAEKLKDAFNTRNYKLNPNTTKTTNFMEYYSDLVTQISNSGSVYEAIYNSQQVTVEESANAREQVLGVSSDEELQFMIQYQNAYNAASRYINTLNSMLENMLNAFGV